jgi:hypothetical protein
LSTLAMPSIPSDSSSSQGPRDPAGRPAPVSPDQNLPPVEPPSARFLLQLFVVPAVIVACVVIIWFGIETLARRGEQDPAAIARELRSSQGYQKANELASMLQMPQRYPELRTNRELAGNIATYLTELVDAAAEKGDADADDDAVPMRFVLAGALGLIEAPEGMPALVHAALEDRNADVRRKAVHEAAVLAAMLAQLEPPQYAGSEEALAGLAQLAQNEDEQIRSWAAVALGWYAAAPDADARVVESLGHLADDPYTDARFNAAQGLARAGNPLAVKPLAEMFNAESIAASLSAERAAADAPDDQDLKGRRTFKRDTIVMTGLNAVELLLEHDLPVAALAPVEESLAQFVEEAPSISDPAPVPEAVLEAAQQTLAKLRDTVPE